MGKINSKFFTKGSTAEEVGKLIVENTTSPVGLRNFFEQKGLKPEAEFFGAMEDKAAKLYPDSEEKQHNYAQSILDTDDNGKFDDVDMKELRALNPFEETIKTPFISTSLLPENRYEIDVDAFRINGENNPAILEGNNIFNSKDPIKTTELAILRLSEIAEEKPDNEEGRAARAGLGLFGTMLLTSRGELVANRKKKQRAFMRDFIEIDGKKGFTVADVKIMEKMGGHNKSLVNYTAVTVGDHAPRRSNLDIENKRQKVEGHIKDLDK